jgi:lipoprotein-releasing system ATP-binding protein
MNIRTVNLSKTYLKKGSSSVSALRNLNLSFQTGEKIAVIGPSGAGKSTLIHILGLMDRPSEGSLFIDEIDFSKASDGDICRMRRENIGFVFQFHYLLADFNVLENILMPVWDRKQEFINKAQDILERIGILSRRDHLPSELSGGERQRAALARALINSPKIIFADEPTGNLDRVSGLEIEKLLFEFSTQSSATLIVVTHNEELALKSDRTIKIEDGGLK